MNIKNQNLHGSNIDEQNISQSCVLKVWKDPETFLIC